MHPNTKRKIIYISIAVITIILGGYVVAMGISGCYYPCVLGMWGCDCPPGWPPVGGQPGGTSLPEGIPGFPWAAALFGVTIALVFVLTIRRRKQ